MWIHSCVWWEGLRRLDADSSLSNVKISSLVNSLHNPKEKVWLVNKGNWVPPSLWSSLEIANYACASFPLEPLRKHSTAKSFQDGVRWLLFHFKPQNGPGCILLSQIWGCVVSRSSLIFWFVGTKSFTEIHRIYTPSSLTGKIQEAQWKNSLTPSGTKKEEQKTGTDLTVLQPRANRKVWAFLC